MSLSALHLANFKAFGPPQRLPLRPLTFVYGPNGAGKSSLIHALLWARHALETGELDAYHTTLGGEAVDLGGFDRFVHRQGSQTQHPRQVVWGASVARGAIALPPGSGLASVLDQANHWSLSLTVGAGPGGVALRGVELAADGAVVLRGPVAQAWRSPLRESGREDDRDRSLENPLEIDWQHPAIAQVVAARLALHCPEVAPDSAEVAQALARLSQEMGVRAEGWLRLAVERPTDGAIVPRNPIELTAALDVRALRQDPAAVLAAWLPDRLSALLRAVGGAIADQLQGLQYLGPFRAYPPRHFGSGAPGGGGWATSGATGGATGGAAWQTLLTDPATRSRVNRWLGDERYMKTPYELVLREWVDPVALRAAWDSTGDLEAALSTLQAAGDRSPELGLVDRRSGIAVSHRDIGIGISQVLPVLVACFALRGAIVAIEQPELHLHPRLQAELADALIESALQGDRESRSAAHRPNQFILETHSEHLLLRVMRRMRETAAGTLPPGLPPLYPEQVALLYVDPEGPQSLVQELPLNGRGELVKAWPGGFFEEGLEEMFA